MLTNLPIPYDLCIRVPIYYFLRVTICLAYCLHSVFNVKVLVGTFNQEKALVVENLRKTSFNLQFQALAAEVKYEEISLAAGRGARLS